MPLSVKSTIPFFFAAFFLSGCGQKFPEPIAVLNDNMVKVPGGTFNMGCTPEQGGDCYNIENPGHEVQVKDFYICKFEVTKTLWTTVMEKEPADLSSMECASCPQDALSWTEIQTFIQKLNQITEKNYRLPSEAEWEYAARGGQNTQNFKYAGSNTLDEVAWYAENSQNKSHAVGTKAPNELGLHDMSGSVSEWCADLFKSYPDSPHVIDVQDNSYVIRGGNWDSRPRASRVSSRTYSIPDIRRGGVGFRLAMDAQ